MENKPLEISWEDVLKIASGRDKMNFPCSSSSLVIDRFKEGNESPLDEPAIDNIQLNNVAINLCCRGACAAVSCDFPNTSLPEYNHAKKMCETWLAELEDRQKDDQYLVLIVVPLALCGYIELIFSNLLYCETIDLGASKKMILIFDNTATTPLVNEETDYATILAQINRELQLREDEIEEQIMEAEEEVKKAKNPNVYEESVKEYFNNTDPVAHRDSTVDQGNVRSSQSSSRIRFTSGDADD